MTLIIVSINRLFLRQLIAPDRVGNELGPDRPATDFATGSPTGACMADNSHKVVSLKAQAGNAKIQGDAAPKGSAVTSPSEDSHLFMHMPTPFVDMKERGKQGLMALLQALFDNIDDALFELADRAEGNNEQNMYFESMREIRIKRRGMEMGFGRELDEHFRQLLSSSVPLLSERDDSLDAVAMESLTLVENDELEELVAADGMIAKAERLFLLPLKQLSVRIDSMVDEQQVTEKSNPFGPTAVCRSFIAVCASLDLDIKAKLVLFKLFDRYVMNDLGQVYTLCNTVLIEGGILPKLQAGQVNTAGAKAAGAGAAQSAPGVDAETAASQQDVFSELQSLFHQIPQSRPAQVPASGLLAPGLAPPISQGALIQLLQALQQASQQHHLDQQQQALQGVSPQQLDVQHYLSTLLAKQMPSKAMSMGQVDYDAINLVAMLFQFILDDGNLAAPMKALIARLQIPMIKVALLDKAFFSKTGHPARKLLNEIASASLGWTPSANVERDPLFTKVGSIVDRLLNAEGKVEDFQEVLTDFIAFRESEQRRSSLIEQRTVNAEDGRAKSEQARKQVKDALDERVRGRLLPGVVIKLLEDAWSNVLFLINLKDGQESEDWCSALAVVDDLLWSVEPIENSEERTRLLKLVPDLLQRLRSGLTRIGYNPFDMNSLFADLETIHLAQLNDKQQAGDNSSQQAGDTDVSSHASTKASPNTSAQTSSRASRNVKAAQTRVIEQTLDQMLENRDSAESAEASLERLDMELDEQLARFDELADLVEQSTGESRVIEEPLEDLSLQRKIVDELHIGEEDSTGESADAAVALDDNDPSVKRVDAMTMGNWVELNREDGKTFRCRLAAIIQGTGKYIFVNRSGMKVAEYNRHSLAKAIKEGIVSTLDEGLLFDRALESVIGNLRQLKTSG